MSDMVRTAGMIAAEINTIKAQARDVVCRSAIEIGRRLYEAKAIVPHGGWIAWLQENVDYSERTAQNLMRVYVEYGRNTNPQAIADLSYTQAVILLGLDRDARAELMENTDVAAMSTRDLQAEVDRLNDEIRKSQVTIDQLLGEQEDASGREKETETQLEEMRSAWQEEKEAAKKAGSEADKARRQMQDALDRAKKAEGEARQYQAELEAEKNKPAPLPVVETVEVVPPEVAAELETLRKKAMAAPNEKVVLLREAYRLLTEQFKAIERLILEVEETEPETAERYRVAVSKGARMMADRLGG